MAAASTLTKRDCSKLRRSTRLQSGANIRIYGTKPSKPLESTRRANSGSAELDFQTLRLFNACSVSGSHGERFFLAVGFFLPKRGPHHEWQGEFVEAASYRSPKRLFNGTKPIVVENKGSLEEQTQTKPIFNPHILVQAVDFNNDN
jgi:hypothetical protein